MLSINGVSLEAVDKRVPPMPRRGEYLFRRKGSQNWWLRLQYPEAVAAEVGRKKLERSLGTPDRIEAEVLAGPEIVEHKKLLLLYRAFKAARCDPATFNGIIREKFEIEPGETVSHPDGSKTLATQTQLIDIDAGGRITGTRANGKVFGVRLPRS